MPWYYNTSSGELTLQTGTLAEITGWINTHTPGLGWHELKVPESATEAQAAADAVKEFPGAATPVTSAGQAAVQQVGSETGIPLGALKGAGAGLAAIAEFLASLTHVETWRSLGWIVLGAILVIAGIYLWLKQNDLIPQTTPVPVPVPL